VTLAALAAWRGLAGDGAGSGDVAVLHVSPEASGEGDGSSWADAAALDDLPVLVESLHDGGEVWLRADDGPYDVEDTLVLSAGGTDGSPIVVRGVDEDGDPERAVLRGGRDAPYSPDGDRGVDVFELQEGAAHLVFRDLAFEDVGNAFVASGDVTDITVEDSEASNVRRFFENAVADDQDGADVRGLVLRDITAKGFSKRFLRLRYASSGILVEDVQADSDHQDGDDFAIGVHLEGEVSDVVLRRVRMDNTRDTLGKYWNGDGFATERDVSDVQFIDTSASGNTDAGYDIKSSSTTLVGASASGNKRNYRFWADDTVAEDCTGTDPVKRGGSGSQAQVWLGEDAAAELVDCELSDASRDSVVFDLEPGAVLTVVEGTIEHEGELKKVQGGATVQMGKL
jgi:hypothetical protein